MLSSYTLSVVFMLVASVWHALWWVSLGHVLGAREVCRVVCGLVRRQLGMHCCFCVAVALAVLMHVHQSNICGSNHALRAGIGDVYHVPPYHQ